MDSQLFYKFFSGLSSADIVICCVVVFFVCVFILFLFHCIFSLHRITNSFKNAKSSIAAVDSQDVIPALRKIFSKDKRMQHCITEFEKNLYKVTDYTNAGVMQVVGVRLTDSSNVYFESANMIDTPARLAAYNHLPGIFTSFGIIGTFYGLITGLQSFGLDTSELSNIQRSVSGLLGSVMHAFIVSATAIFLAVLTTILEKISYQSALSALNDFTATLDSKFDAGVANNFMAELIDLTRQNTTQSKHLKDAFISDLKELLEQNAEHQSERISNAILDTFSGSLGQVADAIGKLNSTVDHLQEYVSGSQKAAGTATEKFASDICSVMQVLRDELDGFRNTIAESSGKLTAVSDSLKDTLKNFSSAINEISGTAETQTKQAGAIAQEAIGGFKDTVQEVNDSLTKSFDMLMSCQVQFARIYQNIDGVADAIETSANTNKAMVAKYTESIKAQENNLQELQRISENFKSGLEESDDVLLKFYDLVEKIKESNNQTTKFAENAALSLEKVFDEFQNGTQTVGNEVAGQLDKLMSNACSKLDSSVNQLQATLEDFTEEVKDIRQTLS